MGVVVSDDGDGISDDARERIFERYEQEGGDTGVSGSFGLGLAISRALARLMGGELACQRTDVTEFILSSLSTPPATKSDRQVSSGIR